ncbi:MAG: SGNH/GDSL hydrolase family protein [Verrucomicrobiota bacterium]
MAVATPAPVVPKPADADVPAVGKLPETDAGLPGAGPIRRYDWFKNLWRTRRVAWAGRVGQDQGAVVFVGDSITQGWGDTMGNSFPGLKVANRGISGDTSRGVLIRLKEDVIDLHPRAVVILIGTNDIEEEADPETIADNMKLILAQLKAADPNMPIILCRVFPSSASKHRPKGKITQLNALYMDLAKSDPQVTMVDTWTPFADENGDAKVSEFPDLLHPNAAGYAEWADLLRPVFVRLNLMSFAAPAAEPR